jgi:lipopolysaccharide export system protein LptA
MRAPSWFALALSLVAAASAAAQNPGAPTGRCQMSYRADHGGLRVTLPSGQVNYYTGGNVVARCPAQSLVLRSDSLESYGDDGRIVFIGHVDYREPRVKLKSDFLTYFQREERVLATRNVVATLPSGSTLAGPQVEFFRAVAGIRQQQYATAIGRPTINLIERDSLGRPQPPVRITANTVYMQGDSIVSAVGNVVVVRPELTAVGDSLYADAGSGLLRMMRQPRITGTKGRPFTLVGETIDLLTKQRKLERVLAKNSAQAHSEDLELKSDTIDLRVANDLLQQAIVWGKSRARATSPTQSIVADSINVIMPAQHVRELHALRNAVAEAMPDTSKFRTKDKDRLTGDTIIAYFDSLPARDTTTKPQIRMTVAKGHATSLQQLAAQDTSLCVPQINYVTARMITAHFDSARVSTVEVNDKEGATGVLLQPDSTAEGARCHPPDAAGAVAADSTANRPAGRPMPNQASSTPPRAATPPAVVPRRP